MLTSNIPWVAHTTNDFASNTTGGQIVWAIGASALNTGDIVYWTSTAMNVDKSATSATVGPVFAGVVVGGNKTNYEAIDESFNQTNITGIAANDAGALVLIQTSGIAKVVSDSAIAIGVRVIPSNSTAGQIAAGTTQGSMVGTTVDSPNSGSGDVVTIFIDHR